VKRELTLTLDGVAYPIVANQKTITIYGRDFTVEVLQDRTVLVDGIVYDVALEGDRATADGKSYTVQVTGMKLTAPTRTEAKSHSAQRKSSEAGTGDVTAIMPGKILRVLVTPGQEVDAGDSVCVLEAMKMENELHASHAGIVDRVNVEAGDAVEKGDVLVAFR